jgi:hypothetical protein
MPTDPLAADLRRRAAELRRYAAHLDATPIAELLQWAGADTWTGPRADELRSEVGSDRRRLRAASDELVRCAWSFEQRADGLDEQARGAANRALTAVVR